MYYHIKHNIERKTATPFTIRTAFSEFSYFDGEYDVTFNIVDIDFLRQTLTIAISSCGRINITKITFSATVTIWYREARYSFANLTENIDMTFSVIAKPLYHFCRQKFEISFYNTLYTHLILTNFAKLKFNCSHIQPPYVFHAGDCHARKLARNDRFGFTCHCERTQ